ncbi:hypothetical protein Dimus_016251 [Dionaea muscipula]
MVGEHRVELDLSGHILPHDFLFVGPQSKISDLPYPDERFICYGTNALALAQVVANASLADQRSFNIAGQLINVTQEAIVDRNDAWRKVKDLEKEIADLRERHRELSKDYDATQDSCGAWRVA